jgi:hypothetical protein
MDRWMNEWVDGWMDDGWMDRWKDGHAKRLSLNHAFSEAVEERNTAHPGEKQDCQSSRVTNKGEKGKNFPTMRGSPLV